jgi:hypothetical protein
MKKHMLLISNIIIILSMWLDLPQLCIKIQNHTRQLAEKRPGKHYQSLRYNYFKPYRKYHEQAVMVSRPWQTMSF